ncbi:MAG: mannose-1-phosphate guanylyltransferase/mannose-6-phosphate isomerase [Candidatus Gastranaerophilales bacterium]|nr:mannose-1-phosphate guanylyltransferase/mannose-6-phosphate isomerase [Candidatus Gastranaerophilales bacterium]
MFGIILAGGSGSRLWPLSRELYPKQLLNFDSDISLLQATFERLKSFMPPENIISITNVKHTANVKRQLEKINDNICVLSEPLSKNTAPAIALATKFIMEKEEDPVILVVPSDHLIHNNKKFHETVKKGERLAQKGYIVTFGIEPTYPETGYGYINIINSPLLDGFKVKEFVEKPDLKTAKKYLNAKTYFWNGGIFMFKASTMIEEIKKLTPEIFEIMKECDFSKSDNIEYNLFNKMPNISIDYAIMEKSDKIALVKLESDWNDLGSWQSIYDISKKDENNNVIIGHVLDEGSKNSLIYASSKLVATIGLDDIVLVETEDAVLACKKDMTQDVKKIFETLKKQNDNTHLVHKTVYRPWGFYTITSQGKGFLTKVIHVNPGQKLSVQSHNHRSEHWVVLFGTAKVILEGEEHILSPGHSIDIPLKAIHSLQNPYEEDLEIVEVQMGELLIEDDIVRYEDMYGRPTTQIKK